MPRNTLSRTKARANVRAAAADFLAREKRLEDLAVDWIIKRDQLEKIREEQDGIVDRFYSEGVSRAEIAERLGVQTRDVPTKSSMTRDHGKEEPDHGTATDSPGSNQRIDHGGQESASHEAVPTQDYQTD